MARSQLLQIKAALYDDIERANPSFATYRQNYTEASAKIDGMQFLQDNRAGLTNKDGTFQANKFNTMMKNIVEDRASGDPTLPASKLTDAQMETLFDIHAHVKRLGNIDLSNPRGSDTNMLSQATNMLVRGGLHSLAGYYAPWFGNAAIELAKSGLDRGRAQSNLSAVLQPDAQKYPRNPLSGAPPPP